MGSIVCSMCRLVAVGRDVDASVLLYSALVDELTSFIEDFIIFRKYVKRHIKMHEMFFCGLVPYKKQGLSMYGLFHRST